MPDIDLLLAARELGPGLRSQAREIEQQRSLPAGVVSSLADTGLFRFWVPRSVGGAEVTAGDGVRTIIEVARHDASAAWCVMIANTTGLLAGSLDPSWAETLFGGAGAVGAGFAQPIGRAEAVEGGLEVTGRWAWGSGSGHATVIGGGTVVVDRDGVPAPRTDGLTAPFVFFEREDVEILDTWHTLGLAGSGSNDYTVERMLVPEGRWVEIGRTPPVEPGPLYRFSMFGLLAAGVAAVAVGSAGRAVEEFVRIASEKTPQGSSRVLAERASSQSLVADATAVVASSTAHLEHALGDAWDQTQAGDPIDPAHRVAIRLAATDATRRCIDVTVDLFRAAGGAAVYRRNPLERVVRDALVVGQHAMVADRTRELLGRLALGLDTDTGQL